MTSTMPLRKAGYREKVFAKSELARAGVLNSWTFSLFKYDSHRDEIVAPGGRRWKVSREGTASKAILAELGADDKDCL